MAGDSIAQAYVTISPDLTAFRDDLRAGLDQAVAGIGNKTVRINADTADAEAAVATLDGSLDDLGARTATPKVAVSDADAKAKLLELQARIDELASEAATVKIGVDDTSTRRTITDLQSALDAFRSETLVPALDPGRLEAINGELDGLDGRLRNIDGDLTSTASSADRAASSLGSGSESGGGLTSMALAAAPALVALGTVGVGAMASVGAAATAAGVGMGAFALAAQPALAQAKADAAGLLHQWQATEAGFTDPVIQNAVGLLPGVFNLLSPSVATTSLALQGLEGQLAGSIGSPYWHTFSQYLAGEGGAAISSFGAGLGGLATLLSGLAEGLAPELSRIDSDVQGWAQDLSRWGQEAANGGLSQFVAYLQQNGPVLAHTLEEVASDAATLARDSAPLGPVWLNIADVAARLLGDLESLDPTLTTLAIGLGSVALAANRLSAPIGGLPGLFTAAKGAWSLAADAFTVGSSGLLGIAGASGSAGTAITSFLGSSLAVVPGLDLVGAALLQASGAFSDFGDNGAKASKVWAQNFVDSLPAGADKVALVTNEISSLNASYVSFDAAYKAAVASGDQATAHALLNGQDYFDQKNALKSILPGLTAAQQGETAAISAANQATAQANGSAGQLGLSLNQLATDTSNVTSDLKGLSTTLSVVSGNAIALSQTNNQVHQAFDALSQSINTNSSDFTSNSDKAAANQAALANVVSAIDQHVEAMAKQGSSIDAIDGYLNDNANQLGAVFKQAGLTTGQIEQLLAQYGLTPSQIQTVISSPGLQQAISGAQTLNAQLAALPRDITIHAGVYYTTSGTQLPPTVISGYATGADAAQGGPAWVGEQGPEAMQAGGAWQLVGKHGPEIRNVPAGARILTAAQTARLPRYADGLGNDLGATSENLLGVTATSAAEMPGILQALLNATTQGTLNVVNELHGDATTVAQAVAKADGDITSAVQALGSGLGQGFQSISGALSSGFSSVTTSISTLGSTITASMLAANPPATTSTTTSTSTAPGGGQATLDAITQQLLSGPNPSNWSFDTSPGAPWTSPAQATLNAITQQTLGGPSPSNWSFDTSLPNGVPWTSVAADAGQSVHGANSTVLLRDRGGPLPPGLSMVANLTGHDEYVLPTPGPGLQADGSGAVLGALQAILMRLDSAEATLAQLPTQVALLRRTGALQPL